MSNTATDKPSWKDEKIMGLPLIAFAILSLIVIVAGFVGKLPTNLFGGFAACGVVGCWLGFVVKKVKFIQKSIGLAFVSIGAALLVYFGIIPENMVEVADNFMRQNTNFLEFYIGALLCGSILGMNRQLLVKSGSRYFVPVIGGVAVAYGLGALVGSFFGIDYKEAIMFIAAPIMGGGNGGGAVPMSQIYANVTNGDQAVMYSKLYPMVTIGNWLSIAGAIVLNALGKKAEKLSGDGALMRGFTAEDTNKTYPYEKTQENMASGLMIAVGFMLFGRVCNKFLLSDIHSYAYTIIALAICKISGIIPERLEFGAVRWYRFILDHFTVLLMGGVGLSMVSISSLLSVLNPAYVVTAAAVVLGGILGAGLLGLVVKFFFIESAITAGLCMSNAGGNGDIMVLSAADRMQLMPFAQISSRLGGAMVLILQSILANLLLVKMGL